jgi:hypothetical protein
MVLRTIISGLLALVAVVGVGGSLCGRVKQDKGIGWQFIRYSVIIIALPLTCILALNGALSEGAAAILAGALGYAFGGQGGPDA